MPVTTPPPTATYPIRVAHTIEYFEKGVDRDGAYYRVRYLIDRWTDTDAFVNFLLGYTTSTGGSKGAIVKRAPHQHPLSTNLFCCEAKVVDGLGAPVLSTNGFPNYAGGATIEAEYRALGLYPVQMTPNELYQQIDPSTPLLYCTQELEFSTETYLLPDTDLSWTTGSSIGKQTKQPFKKEVGVTVMVLTFHRVPYMPVSIIRTLRGQTNNATFLGAAAGLVLFKGAKVTRELDTSGVVNQKVQLIFKEREADWNRMIDPADMTWQKVAGPGGQSPYTQGDFSQLVSF